MNRVLYEAELSAKDRSLVFKAVEGGLAYLQENFHEGANAIDISTGIHRQAYSILKDKDPYREKKAESNAIASAMMPSVRARIAKAPKKEQFRLAVLASIIGNTFDFGVQGHDVREGDFDALFDELFRHGIDADDTDKIQKLAKGGDVVYLTDNCGEIYFDELVLEQLKEMNARITLVVRGDYILTDATMEDVHAMGLDKKVDRVMTTGSNAVGISVKEAPVETLDAMRNASVIIAKGMANYEALSEENFKPIAYLLRAKCEPVANSIGVKKGMSVARLII
jgi:damage-control phosphatase, subfamily I